MGEDIWLKATIFRDIVIWLYGNIIYVDQSLEYILCSSPSLSTLNIVGLSTVIIKFQRHSQVGPAGRYGYSARPYLGNGTGQGRPAGGAAAVSCRRNGSKETAAAAFGHCGSKSNQIKSNVVKLSSETSWHISDTASELERAQKPVCCRIQSDHIWISDWICQHQIDSVGLEVYSQVPQLTWLWVGRTKVI